MTKPIHAQSARIAQALASPIRLRALNLLAQRPWPVTELALELNESVASTSAHLRTLRAACLVLDERDGRIVRYRIAGVEVTRLLAATREVAESVLPELQQLVRDAREDPSRMGRVDPAALLADVKAGRVTLVDLRPTDEYHAGHLPGSRSLPVSAIDEQRVATLPTDGSVVAYCRGPWCVLAQEGVRKLNSLRVPARLLPTGVVEWQAEGMALEFDRSPSAN